MHWSRLTSIVIDCAEEQYESGRDFWSNAFGRSIVTRDERFSSLKGRVGESGVFLSGSNAPL